MEYLWWWRRFFFFFPVEFVTEDFGKFRIPAIHPATFELRVLISKAIYDFPGQRENFRTIIHQKFWKGRDSIMPLQEINRRSLLPRVQREI